MRKFNIKVDGIMHEVEVEEVESSNTVSNSISNDTLDKIVNAPINTSSNVVAGQGSVIAPLQGTVQTIKVSVGDKVNAGDVVAIIEAMKMENDIPATVSGTVKAIYVLKGSKVSSGDVILDII